MSSLAGSSLCTSPVFAEAKPTSNLYQPDVETVLAYSRLFYENKKYTDDGVLVRVLEKRLAEFHQVERVIVTTSGFWALALAISALALPGKSEVIVPAISYGRLDDIIAWAGLTPHFCDIDPETLGPGVDSCQAEINENTALILGTHPMVKCCDAAGIEKLARSMNIPVVFDSVEAVYKKCGSRRVGGFGDAEFFSMHASKLVNAYEGGYITTNNHKLADRLARLRRFGLGVSGSVEDGYAMNAQLNEMHAAMALASFDEVEQQVCRHHRIYEIYRKELRDVQGLELIEHLESEHSDYRPIVVRIGSRWPVSRDETLRLLESINILARPYYSPLQDKDVVYARVVPQLPVTDALSEDFIVLPSGAHVSEPDVEEIVRVLKNISKRSPESRPFSGDLQ